MKTLEFVRTFFIILSVTLIMQSHATLTDWIVIISITLAGTGVSIATFSLIGIRDKDFFK